MGNFILECLTSELNFEQTQLTLRPNNAEICHYVQSYKIVNTLELNQTIIDNFINEQTTLLFNKFQSLDNVPIDIRNNYTL